jgi:hypothetical protein
MNLTGDELPSTFLWRKIDVPNIAVALLVSKIIHNAVEPSGWIWMVLRVVLRVIQLLRAIF